jgi:protein-S-isoprenylcysteine O-methyltransferase Ste14
MGSPPMVNVPPPAWSIAYVLVAAAFSYLTGWPLVPGMPLVPLGVLLLVAGVALSVTGGALFRREGTELDPVSATNRRFVTRGPFRFTRNPMYLGLVAATLGIALSVGAWPMFLAPIAVFVTTNWVHIPFEEAKMRRQFGAEYDAYVHRVRRWI